MSLLLTDSCMFGVYKKLLHRVKVCTCCLWWICTGLSLYFYFTVEISPQTTNARFHLVVSSSNVMFQYFLLPCYYVPPLVFVIPSSVFHTDKAPTFFTLTHLQLFFPSSHHFLSLPCMLSSPELYSWSLTSICSSFHSFMFSMFVTFALCN